MPLLILDHPLISQKQHYPASNYSLVYIYIYTLMSSYHKSSKPVIIHDDRQQYHRQPSADSYYSRSSTASSASHYSTMPNGNGSSSGQSAQDSKTYRSANSSMFHPVHAISKEDPLGTNHTSAGDHLKTATSKNNVTVVNHGSRGYDAQDPHPVYRPKLSSRP